MFSMVPSRFSSLLLAIVLTALLGTACTSTGADPPGAPPEASPDPVSLKSSAAQSQETMTATPSPWDTPPTVGDDPTALTEQLTMALLKLNDPSLGDPEFAWMARLEQAVYRKLVERTEWQDEVIAALPEGLRPVAEANVTAGADLRAMISPGDSLPDWSIVDPAPPDELLSYYQQAEAEFGVPWQYLAAVHLVETVMGRIRGTSIAGAQGPMQFMPPTWAIYGEGDINDTRDAIRAAARYLRAGGAPNNMAKALYSYNHSDRYVRAVSTYAQVMLSNPDAYWRYYHWQVYYLAKSGDTLLPVGYRGE